MRKNSVHTRREMARSLCPIKPTLLVLAIAQVLALQAAQAASIEVTSNLDDGTDCTIREAIATVNAGVDLANGCIINGALGRADAISFGAGVAGSTIVTNGELTISRRVSINSGGVSTTIDANGVGRVIKIGTNITVELDQLTLTGGNTTGNGGGIFAYDNSSVNLSNCTVSGNTARSGGGIFAYDNLSVNLSNSTVSGNTARSSGGGISAYNSPVSLNNSTVSGNSSGFRAGGISAYASSVTLTNSTVSGNSSRSGGGVFAYSSGPSSKDAPVTLTNSTVSGNTAISRGGGIYAKGASDVTLSNSIVANSLGADCRTYSTATRTATADSIIEDGSCDTAAMAVDPLLGPLADNGGPTQTHALLAGSPAIDNGTGPGATAFDQRGVAAEGARDSGAYEFTAAMNAMMIEKLINHRVRETPGTAAELLTGTRYRSEYKVTNNSPNRLYSVRVFEDGNFVCNMYSLMPGQSKQPYRCASNQVVLDGLNNVPANVTAKVTGSNQQLADQTDAYYLGFGNEPGKLKVTHYVDEKNADTKASAVEVNGNEAVVKFRVENTGSINLYRVKLYHDPASPINSGWQELCFIGTLMPGEVRYCKRTISVTEAGLNKAFGRAQGEDANVSPIGYVNTSNPTYFNVVLP